MTDSGGFPETVFTRDEVLDNIMLYWLPGNAASSAWLYWESIRAFAANSVTLPVGCSVFPKDIIRSSLRWTKRKYPNLNHSSELDRGGHFAAFEPPELFAHELPIDTVFLNSFFSATKMPPCY